MMNLPTPYHCRLYVLLAREAPTGVIFRRGPSDWTQVIRWHTATDIFDEGQWFRGRIYEERSDLSPDGSLLLYFARKKNPGTMRDRAYTYAWTAISRPPYLTALALWPKGNCWHGGGVFESNQRVWLNHKPEVAVPHPNHVPVGIEVVPNPEAYGEDYPVWSRCMQLNGWRRVQAGEYQPVDGRLFTRPEIWEKPSQAQDYTLVYEWFGQDRSKPGRAELVAYRVRSASGEIPFQADWADWDQHGRLVFSLSGGLFTAPIVEGKLFPQSLADFYRNQPKRLVAPDWARHW